MDFRSVRIITGDIKRLAGFYERVTGGTLTWYTEEFAELTTPHATLAIGSTGTFAQFSADGVRPGGGSVIIEFLVDDVDQAYKDAGPLDDVLQEPATMPWGNRSLLFRDPDGNLVNFFTPVTPAAIEKFAG
jgi:catechol 2,3-dioxygenase-like lactoylglutathione lyase family enzyme